MKGNAIGFDVGKRRLAVGWPRYQHSSSIDLGKPGMDRHNELALMQREVAALPETADVFIEQPFAGNGGVSAAQGLSETVGMILSTRPWSSATMVHPSTWKKHLLGNHLADKTVIDLWLQVTYPDLFEITTGDEDRVDAMCIGIYGQMVLNGEIVVERKPKPKRRRRAS